MSVRYLIAFTAVWSGLVLIPMHNLIVISRTSVSGKSESGIRQFAKGQTP